MFEVTTGAGVEPAAGTRSVLDRARAARRTELAAAAELLVAAAEWADLHPVPRGEHPAGWGEVDLHGEGLVLLAGTVPAWRARQAAALTTPLSWEMVTWVDKMLACDPQHLSVPRVRRIIEETILHYDPDRAAADEQAALAARHVTLVHDSGPATTEVHMRLDTLDALHLDDTLADLATSLSRLGDTDSLEVRRAKAVGVLADPQRALDLLETGVLAEPTSRGGRVELFVHLASADLADPTRAGGEIERLGAATRGLLAAWLGRPDLAGI